MPSLQRGAIEGQRAAILILSKMVFKLYISQRVGCKGSNMKNINARLKKPILSPSFYGSGLILMALISLSACGEGSHFSAKNSELLTDALTEGQSQDGRPYTAFSPQDEVQKIKNLVSVSQVNKDFAANIESANAVVVGDVLNITLKWKDISRPLIFSGPLLRESNEYGASLKDKTEQRADLEMIATCSTLECQVINLFVQDQKQQKAGIIIRNEEHIMKLVRPSSQKDNENLLSAEKQKAIVEAEKGFPVTVQSTEIYPGRSYYEIKSDAGTIKGELLSTDDGTVTTHSEGKFASLGEVEMIGNNQGESKDGGELQFKVTNEIADKNAKAKPDAKKQINYYLVMDKQRTATLSAVIPKTSVAIKNISRSTGASINPSGNKLVQQILDDEQNENIQHYIAHNMTVAGDAKKNGDGVKQMSNFMACHEGNRTLCDRDHAGLERTDTVKKMISILREKNMPAAWTMISYIESKFDSKAYSPQSGALGYWQFLRSTARGIGLIVNGHDGRTDLNASTSKAVEYFKTLLQYWKGDVKMAVISYNIGQGAVQQACRKALSNKSACELHEDKRKSINDISELYDVNQKDFWRLFRLHAFGAVSRNGKGGEDYTLKFVSGSIVSAHPQKYGYSNHPVDLN
jgi:hypothetical protein